MGKKKTHEEFIKQLNEVHGDGVYIPLEKYINNKTKILVKHNDCGYEWSVIPYSLLNNGCPKCAGNIKKTTKDIKKELYDKYGNEYIVLSEYESCKSKIKIKHKKCNNEFYIYYNQLIKRGCPSCNKIKAINSITKNNEQFLRELKEKYSEEYTPLEPYIKGDIKIKLRHNKCGYEWSVKPASLLHGAGCPLCAGNQQKTHEEFVNEIKEKYGNEYEILGEYINAKTKVLIRHNKCGKSFYIGVSTILKKASCPHCNKLFLKNKFIKKQETFETELQTLYPNEFNVLSKYEGADKKILLRHNSSNCNFCEFETTPSVILRNGNCPICFGKRVRVGINDIATTHPYLVKYFVNKEDAYKHSQGSNKRVETICPDCNKIRKRKICDLTRRGFVCKYCSDGLSYPEKFIINLLLQLNIKYKKEYSPSWIKPKRYDFYIPKFNMIIEVNGKQHYSDISNFSSTGGRDLKQEQANDKYKKEVALKNDIKHYIELDCRESNLEWIQNSILNSELAELFDLSNVNWTTCHKGSIKNIAREICYMYNTRTKDVLEIKNITKINRNTIVKYLKQGTRLGWCNYDISISKKIGKDKSSKAKMKKILSIENGQIFEGCNALSRDSKRIFNVFLQPACISNVCNGKQKHHKGFTFKYVEDLTPEERIKYNIDEKLKKLENK